MLNRSPPGFVQEIAAVCRDGVSNGLSSSIAIRWAACAIGLAVWAGCGKSGPSVEMVQGIVLLDGAPLAGATIGFSPLTPGVGLPASGASGADGGYRLTATRGGMPGRGTAVGDYAVTVTKTERISEPPSEDRPVAPLKIRHVVPEAYGSIATSGLKATVKKGVNKGDAFRFDLKSDYKPE